MSIGQTLAAARTARGMTLDQVSDVTRIRRHIVAAIEADDFSQSGEPFYARAHLRTLARALGVDAAPLLAAYDAMHPQEARPMATALHHEARAARARVSPNWSAAMAVALVVVLTIGVGRMVSRATTDPATDALSAATSAATADPLAAASPSPTASPARKAPAARGPAAARPAPGRPVAAPPPVRVTLTVAKGRSWISAHRDTGARLWIGTLEKGETKVVSAPDRVRLVVANAGSVRLVVNGRDLGWAGKAGKVARLEFGPGDPKAPASVVTAAR